MDASLPALAERLLEQREWLHTLARHLAGAEADELEQETWRAALQHPPAAEVRAWLAATARNLARGLRRARVRRARREERAARHEALPSTAELVERLDTEQRLARALAELREPLRTTLLLRFHEGLGAAEIARRQGVPAGTVRWRTKQGLAELRARLERDLGGHAAFALALVGLLREPGRATVATTVGLGAGVSLLGTGGKAAAGLALLLVALGLVRWRADAGGTEGAASAAVAPAVAELEEGQGPLVSSPGGTSRAAARVGVSASSEHVPPGPSPVRLRIFESDASAHADRLVVLSPRPGEWLSALRTDEEGWLELPAGAGQRELLIERTDAFPYRASVALDGAGGELFLADGEILEGRVRLVEGALRRPLELCVFPARDEAEDLHPAENGPERALLIELATVRTDLEGRFRVRGLRPGQGYNVRLPSGYARPGTRATWSPWDPIRFHVPRPVRGLVLEVERYPSLFGRLVEPDGTPTRGSVSGRFLWAAGDTTDIGDRTDEDGLFELFHQEDWRSIWLDYSGTPAQRGRSTAAFAVDEIGADGALGDLALAAGRALVVRVVDAQGEPIAGACTRPETEPTDARGETRFEALSSPSLSVLARGYHEATLAVPEGASALEVVLSRAPELALEMRAAGGDAPGELVVEIEGAQPFFAGADGAGPAILCSDRVGRLVTWGGAPFVARYRTDEGGRLRTNVLRASVPLVVRVFSSAGCVHEERLAALAPAEWRTLEVRLEQRAVRVRARVIDERGVPLVGVSVALPSLRTSRSGHNSYVRTDEQGLFEATLLPPPGAELTLSSAGFRTLRCPVDTLQEGLPTLVLERGAELLVRVVDETGLPAGGGHLSVRESGGSEEREAPPAAPGMWRITGLGEEEVELELRIGGAAYRRRAHPGDEVELRVPSMGAVEVCFVLPASGTVPEWVSLELRAEGTDRWPLQKSFHGTPEGTHRFEPVLPGSYEVVLVVEEEPELVLARRRLQVEPGVTTRLEL